MSALPTLTRTVIAWTVGLALSTAATATPTRYDFTLDWTTGDLAGTQSQGWFALDNTVLAAPDVYYDLTFSHGIPVPLTGFSFQLGTQNYDTTNVQTGFIAYDANAQLSRIELGTDCRTPGLCGFRPWDALDGQGRFVFKYNTANSPEPTVTMSAMLANSTIVSTGVGTVLPIPEPQTWALMLAGIGLIAFRARRSA